MELGKFYTYKPSNNPLYECLYVDESLAVLRNTTRKSTFSVLIEDFGLYKEYISKHSGSGHLVILSYLSYDKTEKTTSSFFEPYEGSGTLEEYLDRMRKMEYKVISITPVSWEENQ